MKYKFNLFYISKILLLFFQGTESRIQGKDWENFFFFIDFGSWILVGKLK